MISKERVKQMTKLAQYDGRDGRTRKRVETYFRKDYIAMELMKSFLSGTVAFCLLLGMWALYDLEQIIEEINQSDLMAFVVGLGIRYALFMAVYLVVTYIIYNGRYTRGRKELKDYYHRLKQVNGLYQDEENMPSADDWEV